MKGDFLLRGPPGICNAVRRSLLSDVKAWAPCSATIRTNTSCQNDEFLVHRIGLVPFNRIGNGTEMNVSIQGPRTVMVSDITGPGFEAVHDLEWVHLGSAEEVLDMAIHFDERPASKHARYNMCAVVGMVKAKEDVHRLTFETINDRNAKEALLEAIDAVEARVDDALQQLGNQDPKRRPMSFC